MKPKKPTKRPAPARAAKAPKPTGPILPEAIVQRATAELVPYARNSRTHSDRQVAQIAASIKEFGFTNPVLIDAEGGIIAGHGRVLAAQTLGLAQVPCIVLAHLSETQRKAYIIADNKLALNAGWDIDILRGELARLEEENFDLGVTGFDPAELGMLLGNGELLDPTDGRSERGAAMPTLWIGERRVLITSDEADMLDDAFERWSAANDGPDGFAAHLLEGKR